MTPVYSGSYSFKISSTVTTVLSYIIKTIPLIVTLFKKGCTNPCMCGLFCVKKAQRKEHVLVKSVIEITLKCSLIRTKTEKKIKCVTGILGSCVLVYCVHILYNGKNDYCTQKNVCDTCAKALCVIEKQYAL